MQLEQFLCSKLLISIKDLDKFLRLAPNKYKVYTIPKRTSGKRVIAHPSKKLKIIQKTALKHLEEYYKIHQAAYAYKKGIGIKDNAKQHCHNKYLLKMDFYDFFHRITPNLFFRVSEAQGILINDKEKEQLTKLLFWCPSKKYNGKLILSIGAPSSPFISNTIMYLFDKEIYSLLKKQEITYTRYADDITFSTNQKNTLFDIPDLVKELLIKHFYNEISINEKKTIFSSVAHNRHVTGITLSNSGQISIGRKRKRYISSLIYKYSIKELDQQDFSYLQGLLNFAFDIEPIFIQRMEKKYSKELVNTLRKGMA